MFILNLHDFGWTLSEHYTWVHPTGRFFWFFRMIICLFCGCFWMMVTPKKMSNSVSRTFVRLYMLHISKFSSFEHLFWGCCSPSIHICVRTNCTIIIYSMFFLYLNLLQNNIITFDILQHTIDSIIYYISQYICSTWTRWRRWWWLLFLFTIICYDMIYCKIKCTLIWCTMIYYN